MATDRKLISYLPLFMQEYFEMQKIMETEQFEIDRLWLECENALADQFILEATENGVKRWESMLGVSPKDTDSLDERKFRILTKLNQELPFTLRKLEQALTNLCGADGYSIEMNAAEYHVEIKLGLSNKNNYQEIVDVLKKMIPANMIQYVWIMYNNHNVLAMFQHGSEKESPYLTLYGKTTQLQSTGAQMLDHSTINGRSVGGLTLTRNDDYLTIKGTATKTDQSTIANLTKYVTLTPGTYTLSVDKPLSVRIRFNSTSFLSLAAGKTSVTSTITEEFVIKNIAIHYTNGVTYDETFRLMLNKGEEALPYEPYTNGLPAPMPDDPANLNGAGTDGEISIVINDTENEFTQTISMPTPNGLLGVPVESGGNYTDKNGQQWICDEIDFGKRVYIQRVGKKTFDGSERWSKSNATETAQFYTIELISTVAYGQHKLLIGDRCRAVISDAAVGNAYFKNNRCLYVCAFEANGGTVEDWKNFLAENPMTVYYVLEKTVKTPLTEEQSAAFATYVTVQNLHPNAVVTNDDGVGMKIEYVRVGGLSAYTHEQLKSEVFE